MQNKIRKQPIRLHQFELESYESRILLSGSPDGDLLPALDLGMHAVSNQSGQTVIAHGSRFLQRDPANTGAPSLGFSFSESFLYTQDTPESSWGKSWPSILEDSRPSDIVTWSDYKDNKLYAAYSTDSALIILKYSAGQWQVRQMHNSLQSQSFTGSITAFIDRDNLVHLAGTLENGDIGLYSQTGLLDGTNDWEWNFTNLYAEHLAPSGQPQPILTSSLTSYVTRWNTKNIVGIDNEGHIWSIWQPPGSDAWIASDLTVINSGPKSQYSVTVYLTPWDGINIASTDSSGNLHVTWWVPSFGGSWVNTNMTASFDGPKLRPNSITSWVTPWNALNIAGLDAENNIVNYWWTPAFAANKETDRWIPSNISTAVSRSEGIQASNIHSRLQSFGTSQYTYRMSIVASSLDYGDQLISWESADGWTVESIEDVSSHYAPFSLLQGRIQLYANPTDQLEVHFTSADGEVYKVGALHENDRITAAIPTDFSLALSVEREWTISAFNKTTGGSSDIYNYDPLYASTIGRDSGTSIYTPALYRAPTVAGEILEAYIDAVAQTLGDTEASLDISNPRQKILADSLQGLKSNVDYISQMISKARTGVGEPDLIMEDGTAYSLDAAALRLMDDYLAAMIAASARHSYTNSANSEALAAVTTGTYTAQVARRGFASASSEYVISVDNSSDPYSYITTGTQQASAVLGGMASAMAVSGVLTKVAGGAVVGSALLTAGASVATVGVVLLGTGAIAAASAAAYELYGGDDTRTQSALNSAEILGKETVIEYISQTIQSALLTLKVIKNSPLYTYTLETMGAAYGLSDAITKLHDGTVPPREDVTSPTGLAQKYLDTSSKLYQYLYSEINGSPIDVWYNGLAPSNGTGYVYITTLRDIVIELGEQVDDQVAQQFYNDLLVTYRESDHSNLIAAIDSEYSRTITGRDIAVQFMNSAVGAGITYWKGVADSYEAWLEPISMLRSDYMQLSL
jgi:hypothetical protein